MSKTAAFTGAVKYAGKRGGTSTAFGYGVRCPSGRSRAPQTQIAAWSFPAASLRTQDGLLGRQPIHRRVTQPGTHRTEEGDQLGGVGVVEPERGGARARHAVDVQVGALDREEDQVLEQVSDSGRHERLVGSPDTEDETRAQPFATTGPEHRHTVHGAAMYRHEDHSPDSRGIVTDGRPGGRGRHCPRTSADDRVHDFCRDAGVRSRSGAQLVGIASASAAGSDIGEVPRAVTRTDGGARFRASAACVAASAPRDAASAAASISAVPDRGG